MSSNIQPVTNQNTANVNPTSAADPATAAASATMNGGGEKVSSSTKISSLTDLKEKSPKLYNEMMLGIGMGICKKMEHHQSRLKKLMRESQRQS